MDRVAPNADTISTRPAERITIIGTGQVAKSILLTASLANWDIPFRIISRTERSAELIRCHLNDLPRRPSVELLVTSTLPDLSGELVILAAGVRTGRWSRRSAKQQLLEKNAAMARAMLPALRGSRVIVVTNPSTEITRIFVSAGIEAYGVGVGNDQSRFANESADKHARLFLVGAHNFYDLVVGSWFNPYPSRHSFSHADYKAIVAHQDRTHRLNPFARSFAAVLDYDWRKLAERNAAFPAEYRWYARQRIHSKHHDTAISCAASTLAVVGLLTGRPSPAETITVELPLNIPGIADDCLLGWPINAHSLTPLELTFDDGGIRKLERVASKYAIQPSQPPAEKRFRLSTPFDASLTLEWEAEAAYDFYASHLKHLFTLSRTRSQAMPSIATVRVTTSQDDFERATQHLNDADWQLHPQHRGRNPQEHTDLRIAAVGSGRAIRLPAGDATALIDDEARHITFFSANRDATSHELRRILRDEVAIPLMVSGGAHVFHAGICRFEGLNILITGPSGGGKTTLTLELLSDGGKGGYGSAERTLLWFDKGRLVALGIPESITVFPGTLEAIAPFADLAPGIDPALHWVREQKVRLQQSEIVRRTDSALLQGPVPVELVLEVNFSKAPARPIITPLPLHQVLRANDITETDKVRLAWLNWFDKTSDDTFYSKQQALPLTPPAARITWNDANALKAAAIDIVGRLRLGRSL